MSLIDLVAFNFKLPKQLFLQNPERYVFYKFHIVCCSSLGVFFVSSTFLGSCESHNQMVTGALGASHVGLILKRLKDAATLYLLCRVNSEKAQRCNNVVFVQLRYFVVRYFIIIVYFQFS